MTSKSIVSFQENLISRAEKSCLMTSSDIPEEIIPDSVIFAQYQCIEEKSLNSALSLDNLAS